MPISKNQRLPCVPSSGGICTGWIKGKSIESYSARKIAIRYYNMLRYGHGQFQAVPGALAYHPGASQRTTLRGWKGVPKRLLQTVATVMNGRDL